MYERLLKALERCFARPLVTVMAGIVVTVLFSLAIPFILFDNDIKNFLPATHPHRLDHQRFDDVFGSSEMIIIGIESKNAYSKETAEYVRWLKGEIETLNAAFPAQNIAPALGITIEEAGKVIAAINENELAGADELKALFADPARLESEQLWDGEFARKISRTLARFDMRRLLELYRLPISEVKSLLNTDYILGEGSKFVVEKLIGDDFSQGELDAMKRRVKSWSIYDKVLFSSDGTLTAMAVELNPIDINLRQKLDNEIERIIAASPRPGLRVYMAGEPVVSDRISSSMGSDLQRLLPFVLLVMLVVLVLMFRHYEGVLLPMVAIIFSVVWTLGTMALLRIPMSMVSISVPTVLSAVASAYGIHFMTHYYMSSEKTRMGAVMDSLRTSGLAIIIAGLTTVAGFGSLVTSDMTHIRNFGIITAIGVFYALAVSITLIPAFTLLRKNEKPFPAFLRREKKTIDVSAIILSFVRDRFRSVPRLTLAACAVVIAVSAYGITLMEVDMNSMDFFQHGSEMRVADDRINEKLAGTQRLNVNIESADGSPVITPEILGVVERFQADVSKKFPIVGKTVSVNDYLKKMNQEMNGGEAAFYRLPETREKAAEYLLLYSGDIDNMISRNRDRLRIHLSIQRSEMDDLRRLRDYANQFLERELGNGNLRVVTSGYMDMMVEANIMVLKGQLSSLIWSLALVTLLIYLIFRNVRLTLVGLVPLGLGITMNFGVMGFLGIPLNAATALVAAISIGMGIDYSVHFINQFRASIREQGDVEAAIAETYEGTGRAILSNVASVSVGFMVLLFSRFPIIQQCGGLIAFTVFITGVGAIVMIPAAFRITGYRKQSRSEEK